MSTDDYYDILGISKTTNEKDLKKAYRKLALKYHPDRNKSKDAEDKFKEISTAYAVLSNPEKRKIYDQYGHAGIDGQFNQEDIFILRVYMSLYVIFNPPLSMFISRKLA